MRVLICIVTEIALGQLFPDLFRAIAAAEVAKVNLPVAVLVWLFIGWRFRRYVNAGSSSVRSSGGGRENTSRPSPVFGCLNATRMA